MRFYKMPSLLQSLFPQVLWRLPDTSNTIYLTFDDGPIPEITEFVTAQLKQYQAKATFFCVGDNLKKHPEIAHRVMEEGHLLSNHTFNHLSGWRTPLPDYLHNVELCQQQLNALSDNNEKLLFRPPYGQIRPAQAAALQKQKYQVVMWDVLTYDFDQKLLPEVCLLNSIAQTTSGSVVVFHDSLKAARNMQYVLPRFLNHFSEKGYKFKTL